MKSHIFRPLVLAIMDGVGSAPNSPGNAVTKASTPFLEKAWAGYPHTLLHASGRHVGLPDGIKGNSEVGHTNIGAGGVVFQALPRINKAIKNKSFFNNQAFTQAIDHVTKHTSKLHVAICFSDAGVHGHLDHLEAFLTMLVNRKFNLPVIIHAFTDGRDSPPKSSESFFAKLEPLVSKHESFVYGSVIGRYYGMDRNEVWERVELAYDLLASGTGETASSWSEAINNAYQTVESDEFIKPTIIKSSNIDTTVHDNDAFVLLNYRADRAIELTSAFILSEFSHFNRKKIVQNLFYVGMTEYAKDLPRHIAFPSDDIDLPLGRIIEQEGFRQLRIAESEKFPHVTYFFNGGRAIKFRGEDRIEIPSPDVATYDQKPEMSAYELTDILLEKLSLRIYDFIVVNYANGDMVGHSGDLEATIKAMHAVDQCIDKLASAVTALGGAIIITADHGNAEELINLKTGGIDTEHSINPVPFIFITPRNISTKRSIRSGILADITPTILQIIGLDKPATMTGKNLLA
ncbi:MAG: 2,3-bisphosphoglycerate-independent phosphoglycerate mutase [Patescibacteria group bacterium]|nr:2,3-bisphosphoglycerate-independent phosphoglycerate mutase [Patescibacteria group bacterium]